MFREQAATEESKARTLADCASKSAEMTGNVPDEGVDADDGDVVEVLEGLLDLVLVGAGVNEEGEGVGLLELLHRGVGEEGGLDDGELVHALALGNRDASVLGGRGEAESVRASEAHGGADLLDLGGGALLDSLSGLGGLLNRGDLLRRSCSRGEASKERKG